MAASYHMATKIIGPGGLSKTLIAFLEDQENKDISFEFEPTITDHNMYPCKYTFMYILCVMHIIHSGHSIRLQCRWSYFSSVASGSSPTYNSRTNVCSYVTQ